MKNATQTQKFKAIFYAATIAIIINIMILKSAPIFHINAAAGGLFGLLHHLLGSSFHEYGISIFWASTILPQPGTLGFFILFHMFIGVIMSLIYAFILEKHLIGSGWQKGITFALIIWIINSIIIMPLLGKGFAASNVLNITGMIYFFIANAFYGIIVGFLYENNLVNLQKY